MSTIHRNKRVWYVLSILQMPLNDLSVFQKGVCSLVVSQINTSARIFDDVACSGACSKAISHKLLKIGNIICGSCRRCCQRECMERCRTQSYLVLDSSDSLWSRSATTNNQTHVPPPRLRASESWPSPPSATLEERARRRHRVQTHPNRG